MRRCLSSTRRFVAFAVVLTALLAYAPPGAADDYLLSSEPFLIRFSEGDEAVARDALAILHEAMEEFGHRLVTEGDPIRVVLAGDAWTFRRYAGAYARANVGGIARSDEGLIVVKTPALLMSHDFRGVLRHELVHVLLARSTDTTELPRWLNEGLAMMLSNEHRWASVWNVGWMYHQGRLIALRDLDWVLMEPGVEMEFNDAYAQSLSMTRYLQDRIGEDALFALVNDTGPMRFGDAMRKHAGFGPADFYDDWVGSLWAVALVFWLVSGFSVFQLMAFMTIAAWWRKRRQGRRILERWDEEGRVPAPAGVPAGWAVLDNAPDDGDAGYDDEEYLDDEEYFDEDEYLQDDDGLPDPSLEALDEYEPAGDDEWDEAGGRPGRRFP